MATKQKAHSATDDVLQAFLREAAERFKPDAAVLQQRIDTATQRYLLTNTTQRFHAPAPLLIQQMQEKILDGWRYDINIPQSVYMAGSGGMSVTMRKPEEMIEKELTTLRQQVENSYLDELTTAMECEVERLVQDAAEDARLRTEQQAAAEQAAMRERLRNMLTGAPA
ncbi:hypothetical protein [Buttiauxella gaviniae]|uniref:hypothetical protein n=1 Tax=Buttiauxella gaviniae TaxID=82990 RepID=UPI0039AEDEFD